MGIFRNSDQTHNPAAISKSAKMKVEDEEKPPRLPVTTDERLRAFGWKIVSRLEGSESMWTNGRRTVACSMALYLIAQSIKEVEK